MAEKCSREEAGMVESAPRAFMYAGYVTVKKQRRGSGLEW
jgi:hypothetical protein